ncbi:DUF5818 domain-containing protein [Sphingosinicella sp. LY1275]|uniref:DUF5818 domain-containing protein n=1 Tax=Sphingosinicella sp. LY1275 TaxID=3095379 RepID=UPI002ADEB7BA|nr:DUF5818 domain-containing protein [Sphingosinicella sp. LY1275]MEA1015332.1 DUF5818 domain-containing protein [Sphingosinicella sp. LY1275]
MPIGSFHSETGLLLRQRGKLILQRDNGGRWRLEAVAEAEHYLGQRVAIEGIRSGFDLLEVIRMGPC